MFISIVLSALSWWWISGQRKLQTSWRSILNPLSKSLGNMGRVLFVCLLRGIQFPYIGFYLRLCYFRNGIYFLFKYPNRKIETKRIKMCSGIFYFYPLTSNKFNDLLKCFFSEGFLLCIHSRACFTMDSLAMRNRGKRARELNKSIWDLEFLFKGKIPLGNTRFKYDVYLFEFTLQASKHFILQTSEQRISILLLLP